MHDNNDLISLFNSCFYKQFHTRLYAGADEPLYLPSENTKPAAIYFREDFFSSALHEIAHWCIAGEQRRKQQDYGYWYIADGRDAIQQAEFYRVEVKPQALEWCFSVASSHCFRVSVDNLETQTNDYTDWEQHSEDITRFKQACFEQVSKWLEQPELLPERGHMFITLLIQKYRQGKAFSIDEFNIEAI